MSELLYKGPCEACGSSDANATYDDGHTYCFSCEKSTKEPGAKATGKITNKNFIDSLKPRAIQSRGLKLETCQKFGYECGTVGSDILHVAPYYSKGEMVAQHVRKVADKDFYWIGESKGVDMYGQHLWGRDKGRQIVITEGEIDCLTLAQCLNLTWPVVSIPSGVKSAHKAILKNFEFINNFENIIVAFDDDEPGRLAVEDVVKILPAGKVKVMHYDGCKDANELYLKSGAKAVVDQVYNATPYRPDGIVSGKEILKRMLEKPQVGFAIDCPILNEKLMGIDKKRIHMFTAGSGIGKSTFVHEIGHQLVHEHGMTLGIFALEESVREAALRHVTISENQPLHLDMSLTDEQVTAYYDKHFSDGHYHFYEHFGSSDIDVLLSKIRYAITALQCDFIILDHISIVVSGSDEIGESERKTIDKLMTKLRQMVEETGAGVLAIVHLKRPQGNGKGFNEGRAVSLSDLRGSGGLEQLSDNVIAMERDQQGNHPNHSRLRVLKNRKCGRVGIADCLYYNETTGRLRPTDDNPFEEQKKETGEDYGF